MARFCILPGQNKGESASESQLHMDDFSRSPDAARQRGRRGAPSFPSAILPPVSDYGINPSPSLKINIKILASGFWRAYKQNHTTLKPDAAKIVPGRYLICP
jgi:hypothetical protein